MIIEAPPVIFLEVPDTTSDVKASVWTLPRDKREALGLTKVRGKNRGQTDPIARARGRSLRVEKRLSLEQMASSPCKTVFSAPTGAELTCEIGGRSRQVLVQQKDNEIGVTVRDPNINNLFEPVEINTGDIANLFSAATGADALGCAVATESDPKNADYLVPGPGGRMQEKFPGVILAVPAQACGVAGPLELVEAMNNGPQVDAQAATPNGQTASVATAESIPTGEPTLGAGQTDVAEQPKSLDEMNEEWFGSPVFKGLSILGVALFLYSIRLLMGKSPEHSSPSRKRYIPRREERSEPQNTTEASSPPPTTRSSPREPVNPIEWLTSIGVSESAAVGILRGFSPEFKTQDAMRQLVNDVMSCREPDRMAVFIQEVDKRRVASSPPASHEQRSRLGNSLVGMVADMFTRPDGNSSSSTPPPQIPPSTPPESPKQSLPSPGHPPTVTVVNPEGRSTKLGAQKANLFRRTNPRSQDRS